MVALPTVAGARLTDTYGWQDWRGYSHAGIDFAGIKPGDQPKILAFDDGVVEFAGWNLIGGRNGYHIGIRHASGYLTFYGHVSGSKVKKGGKVKKGQHIATMDKTGLSATAGIHLHFEVWDAKNRLVDPLKWLADRGIHFKQEKAGESKRLQALPVIAPAGKPASKPVPKPKPKTYRNLKKGMAGADVLAVARALRAKGYTRQGDTRTFTEQLRVNVKDWQRRKGLYQDAVAGKITQQSLGL